MTVVQLLCLCFPTLPPNWKASFQVTNSDSDSWLLPCWKRVCSGLRGAATGLFSTGGGAGGGLRRCSRALGVLTRGGTTAAAAAGSGRSPGWRGRRRRGVTGHATVLQPVGIQLHFVWGMKEWRLRVKPYRNRCAAALVLNLPHTCALSGAAAAVLLDGPCANRWAGCRDLLLTQLPVSQMTPSGVPWRTTLRTPRWVAVTSGREWTGNQKRQTM